MLGIAFVLHCPKKEKGDYPMNTVIRFVKDDEGVTAIEYGLIAGLIAVAIIAGATLAGVKLDALFTGVANKLVPPT